MYKDTGMPLLKGNFLELFYEGQKMDTTPDILMYVVAALEDFGNRFIKKQLNRFCIPYLVIY